MQWYLPVPEYNKSKLHSRIPPKISRKSSENICHIEFFNKAVGLINPSVVFNNINLTSKLNETCNDFPIPTIACNLANPIFDFSTFISNINVDVVSENPESLPLIVIYRQRTWTPNTDDLGIISDKKLCKTFLRYW